MPDTTPWQVANLVSADRRDIVGNNGKLVATCTTAEYAEQIVRCINSQKNEVENR